MGDTVVLVTAVAKTAPKPGQDFFPLTVDYIEKTYAAGRIPGGFFKREGRPTEKETLTSRLIDRPIRPLFPDGFHNEVQVVATVLSLDPEIDADIPALIGASAALSLSGHAVQRPDRRRARRLHRRQVRAEPDRAPSSATSQLDLVVAGTEHAVLMVESEAKGLSEEVMLGAVVFGHEQMQVAIGAIQRAGAPKRASRAGTGSRAADERRAHQRRGAARRRPRCARPTSITEKQQRHARISEIKAQTLAALSGRRDAEVHCRRRSTTSSSSSRARSCASAS